ncbi:GT4 family glycosyltransferase PelF [Deinococcus sonorensis]|uniref:GT4 family glycosyltransferase PelF n=2 Tax=Deinococcus sonorensis TaxID=309891 RepID=A0AAU7U4P3_9DEIO
MSSVVSLITEGTYPLYTGGVSVWCEQLVTGLPEVEFRVLALSGLSTKIGCTLPENVRQVDVVPLWESLPVRGSRPRQRAEFQELYARVLGAMLKDGPEASADFIGALNRLSLFARRADLHSALAVPSNAQVLLQVWLEHVNAVSGPPRMSPTIPRPTISDALSANMWLIHLLRPLATPAPEADLTHAVSNGLSVLPAIAAKAVHGTPFLLTEHGVYLRERYLTPPSEFLSAGTRAFLLRFHMHLTRAAYTVADIISPASNFNTRWQLHFGADVQKLHPVYNGIDPALFTLGETEPSEPTVAWVGRVDPIKDLDTLIRAHALIQHHIPSAHLRMFGPIPQGNEDYERTCRQLIHDLGLDETARFEGRVPSVAQAYQAGHVVALSSISEGFPYSVIEAMATGRPMVATDVGGVREAVGDTGFVVPPRDPRAFAEACQALLSDHALRRRMSLQARERVLTLFTVQHCLDAYQRMYTSLMFPASMSGA